MTSKKDLLSWNDQSELSPPRKEAEKENYDLLPVIQGERVTGVLRVKAETDTPEPLTNEWLVSCDTEIPNLIELFTTSEKPGFFVLQRQDVIGLVTPADLNKVQAGALRNFYERQIAS